MIGTTVSHYTITEKIGEGGMGVVFKAHDVLLDRDVALKFLPQHLTTNEEDKKRFIHEAKAASALQHNNICTIHEINETNPDASSSEDSQIFICMDHYSGETLDKINTILNIIEDKEDEMLEEDIQALIDERQKARKEKKKS